MELSLQPTIRRRSNGTIDIDHYRKAALTMRRCASVDMLRRARPALRVMAGGAALRTVLGILGAYRRAAASISRTATMAPVVEPR